MNTLRPTLYLLAALFLLPSAHATTATGGDAAAAKPKGGGERRLSAPRQVY